MKYVQPTDEASMFFSSYGSFVHSILEMFYAGELSKEKLLPYFISNYFSEVTRNRAPKNLYVDYFKQGMDYFKNFKPFTGTVMSVESGFIFRIDRYDFVGIPDLIFENESKELCIVDNKSRNLKARSTRKKPTKADAVLDEYLRQLYLYSTPTYIKFGRYPDKLIFNCFKTNTIIEEPFVKKNYDDAMAWFCDSIQQIKSETKWRPNIDDYYCRYICGLSGVCEYYAMYNS